MMHHPEVPLLVSDMVWPALLLEQRLLGVVPIAAGLAAEWLALYFGGFGLSWKKAAVVDVVMNAVSSLIGYGLIPLLGLAWVLFSGFVLEKIHSIGVFSAVSWVATGLLSTLATTVVEAGVVRWGFRIGLGKRRFWILFAANLVSVGFALGSLWLYPPKF